MRFATLVCLVVVAICVYADQGGARQSVYRKSQSNRQAQDQSSAPQRPLPQKKPSGGNGKSLSEGRRSIHIGRAETKSLSTCDYRTSQGCFRCVNPSFQGEGAPILFINDGYLDCKDASDEKARQCTPTATNRDVCFACSDFATSREGVLMDYTCDSIRDCKDGSDEDCRHPCNAEDYENCFKCLEPKQSGEEEYMYPDFLCDNRVDCFDASDELCFECDIRGYRYCDEADDCNFDININHVCDGKLDCRNGEDEIGCFQCANGDGVIDPDWVCDHYNDCTDKSDELPPYCNGSSADNGFQCANGDGVINPNWVCDGDNDCTDKSDELPSYCNGPSTDNGDCYWLAWNEWSDCSNSCGAGKIVRERACSCQGGSCGRENMEERVCHDDSSCPKEAGKGCGTRQTGRERIVGGDYANQANWPWQAQLLYKGKFFCGGTLYNNKYVISAAHCFGSGRDKPSDWEIHFGKQDTFGLEKHKSDVIDIIYNGYNDYTLDNDIVVMVLKTPIPYTENVNNICLDVAKTKKFGPSSNCFITGFGLTEDEGKVANDLQEAAVPYITPEVCRKTEYMDHEITDNMFCAGYPNLGGIDACQGDSGGPLVCTAPDDANPSLSRWYLVGVTSWGIGCAKVNLPGVYTDVSQYIDWLVKKTP